MPVFNYRALDKDNKSQNAKIEAVDREGAINTLKARGLTVISVEDTETIFGGAGSRRASSYALVTFTEDMASLLKSGLSLEDALEVEISVPGSEAMKRVITDLLADLRGGQTFYAALGRHPKFFSGLYISMVRAGEESGALDSIMERLARFLRRSHELRSSIYSALIYPFILTIVAIASIVVLMSYVVPKIVGALKSTGKAMPWTTQMLINISDFFGTYWILFAVGVFACVVIAYYLGRRGSLDGIKLHMPFLGGMTAKLESARVSAALGTLLGSGVATLTALDITSKVCGTAVFSESIKRIAAKVRDGIALSVAIEAERANNKMLPALFVKMVRVGEETGDLTGSLLRMSERFEQESGQAAKRMLTIFEPALIIFMGVVVGFVVLAIISAIFSVNTL